MGLDSFKTTLSAESEKKYMDTQNTEQSDARYRDGKWLEEKLHEGKSYSEIADICGVSSATISKWKNKHDIDLEDMKDNHICSVIEDIYNQNGYISVELINNDSRIMSFRGLKYRFGTVGNIIKESGTDVQLSICASCGNYFLRNIAEHYNQSDCSRPTLSEYSIDILTGLMMGDAWYSKKNQRIGIELINKRFLEWLESELDDIFLSVRPNRTAEEMSQKSRDSGFNEKASKDDYNNTHTLHTISHPELSQFNWYIDEGDKIYPADLVLNSEVLKMWYCCDGGLQWSSDRQRASFKLTCKNESDRLEHIHTKFMDIGFNPHIDKTYGTITFGRDETENILDYIGAPPEGFEYKWCLDSYSDYKCKKGVVYE